MPPSSLDCLPTEILLSIAETIGLEHGPSASSFAIVNKTCHAAIAAWRLQCLTFKIDNSRKLRRDVNTCLQILNQNHGSKYVRQLKVTGHMLANGEDDELSSDNDDAAWEPLVELFMILPHPRDFIFNCSHMLPSSFLSALHNHKPRCRLHLGNFRFRGLQNAATNAHDMAIATSPSLYSLRVKYTTQKLSGRDDYTKDAIMCLVGGLAPNLKKLYLICYPSASSANLNRLSGRPREPWRGFGEGSWSNTIEDPSVVHQASLEFLTLCNGSIHDLRTWQRLTSFDTLRALDLRTGMKGDALQWAAANTSFRNLTELHLELDRDDQWAQRPDFRLNAIAFVNSLPALTTFDLSGSMDPEIFDAVLERHGSMLRDLSLRTFESMYSQSRKYQPMLFTRDHVQRLQESCPLLETLAIPIQRTKGSTAEVDTYRAFGKMRRLTKLFLTLNYSNPVLAQSDEPPNGPAFDECMQAPYGSHARLCRGHVYDILLNAAIDEPLARSIWTTLDACNRGRALRLLFLLPAGNADFGFDSYARDLLRICGHVARNYQIKRNVRDDQQDEFSVKEISRKAREARDEQDRGYHRNSVEESLDTTMGIFRRIWPQKEGSVDWREDWSSLPLQL